MPKYVVTGGESGTSGIEVAGTRYAPGDVVDIAAGKKDWRIGAGYLELESTAKKRARDDNGHFVADDPDTPAHAAYEEAPAEGKPTPKKSGGK